ncbi:MAG: AraC-like DNA-binding protein [Sulfurimonas sp.]|jgi:AraC-like DNA-binding protein
MFLYNKVALYIMIYDIFYPANNLESIVSKYVVVNSFQGIENLIFLPNGCNFIVFNRGHRLHLKAYTEDITFAIPLKYSVSVKTNKVRRIILDKSNEDENVIFPIIMVELTPVGYYILFNKKASVLKNTYQELEEHTVNKYFEKLYTHHSVKEELEYLNKSLTLMKEFENTPHIDVLDIVEKIVNSYHFEVTVESLTEEFSCSRSTLERRFKQVVGLTPKNFIYVAKFCQTVLAYVEDGCTYNELEYIYCDNSHMNAVFKKFLGISPSVLFSEVANNNIKIYQMHKIKA